MLRTAALRRPDIDPPWLAIAQALEGRMTELASAVRGLQLNAVLRSSTDQLNATGRISLNFDVPFATVAIRNLGVGLLTVAAAGEADQAPTTGVGVHLVPGEASAVIALTGTTLTLYGDAGGYVSLAVYSRPQPPSFT